MRISDWRSDVCSSDLEKTRRITSFTDRATIILAVYVAFSEATNEGLWQVLPVSDILRLALLSVLLLALVMLTSGGIGRMLGFSREDRIAIVFCGSKKSLATDIPMARSEEHTSELQSLMRISYAVFCLKKKTTNQYTRTKKNI